MSRRWDEERARRIAAEVARMVDADARDVLRRMRVNDLRGRSRLRDLGDERYRRLRAADVRALERRPGTPRSRIAAELLRHRGPIAAPPPPYDPRAAVPAGIATAARIPRLSGATGGALRRTLLHPGAVGWARPLGVAPAQPPAAPRRELPRRPDRVAAPQQVEVDGGTNHGGIEVDTAGRAYLPMARPGLDAHRPVGSRGGGAERVDAPALRDARAQRGVSAGSYGLRDGGGAPGGRGGLGA